MSVLRDCLSIGETEDEKQLKMEQACRDLHSSPLGRGFNSRHLHQNKFSACKSADDCKQFFCAFCGCFARIYRKLRLKQRISKMDFFACVLNKISCFSLFLSHSSPDDWKIHKALESKMLQKHTPKYLKSLFLKIENIKVLWKTASENNLKKYDFELNP